MEKKQVFYGWWVAATCFLLMALGFATIYNCASLYVTPITEEFGITKSAYSVCMLISAVMGMLSAPFAGKIISRYNIRYIMTIAMAGLCLCFGSLSFAQNVLHLYIINFFLGICFTFCTTLPVSILLTRWFVKSRGTVMSVVFAGSSIGGMILTPIVNQLITRFTWQGSYRIMAIVLFVCIVPVIFLVIRSSPADKNLLPLGADDAEGLKSNQKNVVTEGLNLPLKVVKKKPVFLLTLLGLVGLLVSIGSLQHIPSFVIELGFDANVAANIASIYLGVGIIGKIILGLAFDKLGTKSGILIGVGSLTVAFVLLLFSNSIPLLILMAVFYGIGSASGQMLPPVITTQVFGTKYYSEIYGVITAFVSLGAAIGPFIVAIFFDVFQTYRASWFFCLATIIVTALIFNLCLKLNSSQKPEEDVNIVTE